MILSSLLYLLELKASSKFNNNNNNIILSTAMRIQSSFICA